MSAVTVPHHRVAIVGAGFGGLGAAIRLEREGIDDVVVLERRDDVGGTWDANRYPGCACDVPSHLYSFSFATNPDWSRSFSRQSEIQRYLRGVADAHGVTERVRFGTPVEEARWDEAALVWRLELPGGETLTADVLVGATGALSEPALPDIPGVESFAGPVIHSADWPQDDSVLDGARVAVIGTGASAIQFVPRIQPRVASMDVYQRTPPWIAPRMDRPRPRVERALFRAVPGLGRLARESIFWSRELVAAAMVHAPWALRGLELIARAHLRAQVRDPALRRKLLPDYRMGCKRILISNDYLPALDRPNVDVITDGIAEIRPGSVVSRDGVEREADVLVLGTGFHVTDSPAAERIVGVGGVRASELWDGSPRAYRGTTVNGFPNHFLLAGPNTGIGHTSLVYMIEAQLDHVVDCLRELDRTGAVALEVTGSAQDEWNARIDRDMDGSVWTAGGCASWYLDRTGRNSTLWPGLAITFRRELRSFDREAYALHHAAPEVTFPGQAPADVTRDAR